MLCLSLPRTLPAHHTRLCVPEPSPLPARLTSSQRGPLLARTPPQPHSVHRNYHAPRAQPHRVSLADRIFPSKAAALAHTAADALQFSRRAVHSLCVIRRPELSFEIVTAAGRLRGARGPRVSHTPCPAAHDAAAVPRGGFLAVPRVGRAVVPRVRCTAVRRVSCPAVRRTSRRPYCRPARPPMRRPAHQPFRRPAWPACPELSTPERHEQPPGAWSAHTLACPPRRPLHDA